MVHPMMMVLKVFFQETIPNSGHCENLTLLVTQNLEDFQIISLTYILKIHAEVKIDSLPIKMEDLSP